jgi:hypothetical protein
MAPLRSCHDLFRRLPTILEVSTLLLVLVGLMLGSLLGVATTLTLVARRTLAETGLILDPNDSDNWLSPGPAPGTGRGEPRGSQEEPSRRTETGAGHMPGLDNRPANAAPSCEGSRSSRRVEIAATPPTPTNPPRRDRRDPSAGWTRLSHHAHRSHQYQQLHHSGEWPSQLSGTSGPPREEGEEQWTAWG